uniref:(California timema) hypothetical protein n=1 Tax=Timema californicum TaxID=61474 RepID=A0A7R9J8M1_TIMCA|nr:unnamed protein product [Timema californicum]
MEPSFPYRDIVIKRGQDVKDLFLLQTEIGRGKFGTVYRCQEHSTGLQLAAKFVSTSRREDRRNVEREIDIMRALQHPRLIQLYDAFDNGKMMVLILELLTAEDGEIEVRISVGIEGGELFERVIDDDFILTEKSCTVFMRQICEGIEFIHQQNIIHLDMKVDTTFSIYTRLVELSESNLGDRPDSNCKRNPKVQQMFGPSGRIGLGSEYGGSSFRVDVLPSVVIARPYLLLPGFCPENILCLTRTGNRIKIIDFGLARKLDPNKKLQVLFGTPEFVAPEVVNFDQIGFGTDMWSVGVICYVLLSGLSPFMGETDIETMANVTIAKYDFDDEVFNEISEDAKDFIKKLLLKDRDGRMTASQCVNHAWLKRPSRPEIIADGLDMSKDNLRFFVERWNEHPNSPYLFDVTGHIISPCPTVKLADSRQSLTGCSPSPCGSLSTSPDSVVEVETPLGKSPAEDSPRGFLHYTFEPAPYHLERLQTFERRASDSSCFLRNTGDTASRVNLADEIRKLSDKLFQMAALHPPDYTNNNHSNDSMPTPNPALAPTTLLAHSTTSSTSYSSNIVSENRSSSTYHKITVPPTAPNILPRLASNLTVNKLTEDTAARRTKFRVSNLNRDVPVGLPSSASNVICFANTSSPSSSRNSSDISPSRSLSSGSSQSPCTSPEPAHITKDLLLRLLSKWDDTQTLNQSPTVRKSSISADWTDEDSLGQHSMNSLASYFQSSRTGDKKHPVIPP